jgi:hypothetical protein
VHGRRRAGDADAHPVRQLRRLPRDGRRQRRRRHAVGGPQAVPARRGGAHHRGGRHGVDEARQWRPRRVARAGRLRVQELGGEARGAAAGVVRTRVYGDCAHGRGPVRRARVRRHLGRAGQRAGRHAVVECAPRACARALRTAVTRNLNPHPHTLTLPRQWSKDGAAKLPSSPTTLADLLIEKGLELNSRDNMSAVIVKLAAAPEATPEAVQAWNAKKAETAATAAGGGAGSGSAGGESTH